MDAMSARPASEYVLRARDRPDTRPIGQLTDRQRGLRAAFEVLKGSISPRSAKSKYQVNKDSLGYYKRKLVAEGVLDTVVSVTPVSGAAAGTPATGEENNKENICASRTEAWDEYCQAYIKAGQLVAHKGLSKRRAAQQTSEEFKVHISPTTALRAAEHPGMPPSKPGRQLILGELVENRLEMLCLVLREMRIPIFQAMVLNYANSLIKGTAQADLFKHKEVRKHWYYHWLHRCKRLKTGNIRPLEITRAKWATAANALTHYNQLAELLVELGLAVRNPSFKEDEPKSEPIKLIKPERVFSMDETRLTNDTSECSKAKSCRIVLGAQDDDGSTLVNKGGGDGTGIGGSSADGRDTPAFIIFANNIIHAGEQDADVADHVRPACRRQDPSNPSSALPCRFWANLKGGVTGDLGIRYIRGCVEPCLPDLSPENPAVLIMDGHGSHFTLDLLEYCRALGLHVVLRPPHTTHVLQGEDVEHFAVFKPLYQQKKLLLMGERLFQGKSRLTAGDLLLCAKEAWERAFDLEHTLKAWAKIGISPFTRCVYWDLKAAEDKRNAVAAKANINPEKLTIEGMVSIFFPGAAERQQQVNEGGGQQPADDRRKKRRSECNLHSTDLWHLPGGATGDECFEIVKEKTLARRAKESKAAQSKVARVEARKEKQASANQLGANICAKLTSDEDVKKLKVPELKAALIYKGVAIDPKLKKADLTDLLSSEMRGSYVSHVHASPAAGTSAEVEPEVEPSAADFIDSSESDSGSESSEWPHSEADDH